MEANLVVQRLFAMKEYQQSRNVSVYISMPSAEISTTEIIKDLFAKSEKNPPVEEITVNGLMKDHREELLYTTLRWSCYGMLGRHRSQMHQTQAADRSDLQRIWSSSTLGRIFNRCPSTNGIYLSLPWINPARPVGKTTH